MSGTKEALLGTQYSAFYFLSSRTISRVVITPGGFAEGYRRHALLVFGRFPSGDSSAKLASRFSNSSVLDVDVVGKTPDLRCYTRYTRVRFKLPHGAWGFQLEPTPQLQGTSRGSPQSPSTLHKQNLMAQSSVKVTALVHHSLSPRCCFPSPITHPHRRWSKSQE